MDTIRKHFDIDWKEVDKDAALTIDLIYDGSELVDFQLVSEPVPESAPLPNRGLYLVSPHGQQIADGTKTHIAKGRRFALEGEWALVTKIDGAGAVLGRMTLGDAVEVGQDEFDARQPEHQVSRKERRRWWPEAESLWLYPVKFEPLDAPLPLEIPAGTQTVIRELDVEFEALLAVARKAMERVKGGPGSGWHGSPRGTHDPGSQTAGPRFQIGITSAPPYSGEPRTLEQVKADMETFRGEMEQIEGVKNLQIEMGTGGWNGGSEPTWITSYIGNGEAQSVLAKTGKRWNQDAVLIMRKCAKGAPCQPQNNFTFDTPMTEGKIRLIEGVLVENKLGGWTWGKQNGKLTLMTTSIPEWGGDPASHRASSEAVLSILQNAGVEVSMREDAVDVTLMTGDNYDDYIG